MPNAEKEGKMADLWFKIKADTSELDEAYKRLAEINKMVRNFNKGLSEVEPGGKKFKELSKQLSTLEKDYESAVKKIAELENALKSVSEAKNVVSQTKEITDNTNEAIKVFVKYTGSLDELDKRVKGLTKEYLAMTAAQKASSQGQSIIDEIAILNSQRKIESDSLRALQKEYINTQKMQDLQEGSIVALRAELSKLLASYDNLGRSMRKGTTGKELLASIQNVTKELNEAEQASMRFQRSVGNYASGWNGLNVQIQQVARELPSLAIGANTFFLAISNNLPMLVDELQKARKEFKTLKAEGKAATPVWKQFASSLFSWQTALVAGITIFSVYGKEIFSWAGSLFTAKKTLSETYQTTEDFQKKVGETSGSVIATLEKLSEGWKRLGHDIKAQEKYIIDNKDAINSMGVSVNNAAEAERIFNKNKEAFILGILQRAKASATMELAAEEYKKAVQKMIEADAMPEKKTYRHFSGTLFHGRWETRSYNNTERIKAEEQAADFIKSGTALIQKYAQFSEEEIKILESIGIKTTKTMIDGSIEAIEAAISLKQQELKKVTNPKDYQRIETQIKAEQAKLKAITGEKDKFTASNYIDSYTQAKEIQNSSQAIKDAITKYELSIQQQQIDLMEDGSDKELALIRLNYEKRYQEIVKEERELLQKLQEEERKQWEKTNPKFKEKNLQFIPTITSLTPEQRAQFDKEYSLAYQKQEKDTKALLDKLLEKYRDYDSQRIAIEKQGNEDIAYLQSKRTDANAEEIDRAIKVAQDKIKEGVQQINDAQAEAATKDNDFFKLLFGDVSSMSFGTLQNLISQAKQLREYLSGNGDSKGITFISPEQLKAIEKSPAELDKLKKALDKLLKGNKSNSWDAIFDGFTKGVAKLKSAKGFKEISEGMQDIGQSASEASSMLSGVAGSLSSMFEEMGNTEVAEALSGMQQVMSAISNIGQGFAKGGIVGGIAAAVGEAANFIGQAFAANARHKAALKEIMNETIAQQREYNLLLMQQNLEYEKAATIFGTDVYGKAANADTVMKNAVASLNAELKGTNQQQEKFSYKNAGGVWGVISNLGYTKQKDLYSGLADIQIKTGHKKTGLFGWGKGKDIYSSILDVYPQLIDANGKFNKSLAETILNTREMSDESKASLQNMIDLAQQAEDAFDELKNYMTDIFGDLGNDMSNALADAFTNGTNAAKAFTESVSDMLETLAKQMVYSVTIGPLMEKAQTQMLDVMKDTSLSKEDQFKEWANILNGLVSEATVQQQIANQLYEEYQQAAAKQGINIFKPESSQQSTAVRSFQTMSQDTAEELNGRFTALQVAGEEIKNQSITQTNILSKIYERLEMLPLSISTPEFDLVGSLAADKIQPNIIDLKGVMDNLSKIASNVDSLNSVVDEIQNWQAMGWVNINEMALNFSKIAKTNPDVVNSLRAIKDQTKNL